MTYQTLVDYLVIGAAIPATLFVILYPIILPKLWRSWVGRALWTSSFGLAALLDLSLLAKWFDLILPRVVVAGILAVIMLGAILKLAALLRVAYLVLRGRDGGSALA